MNISTLLTPERTAILSAVSSKKRLLETTAQLIVDDQAGIDTDQLFRSLIKRERLGSTGLGRGIAIPHGRVAELTSPRAALIRLDQAIDYDAVDGEPVDLVFGLAIPEGENNTHLSILAALAERLSDARFCANLRAAENAEQLLLSFSDWPGRADQLSA